MFKGIIYGNIGSGGNGGNGGGNSGIVKSDKEPEDTSVLWLNEDDYLLYYYDTASGNWLKIGDKPVAPQTFDYFGDNSALALYQFDGNMKDTGGQFDGTLDKGTETYDTGNWDKGFKFDKSTDIKIDKSIFDNQDIISISLWYSSTQTDSPTGLFSFRGGGNGDIEFILCINRDKGGDIGIDVGNGDSYLKYYTDDINSNDGNWHHLVFIIDFTNTNVKVYFDGAKKIDETNDKIAKEGTPDKVLIGSNHGNQEFEGIMDELRIFSKAVSDDEVTKLYKND